MNSKYAIIKQDRLFKNYVCDALFCIGGLNIHYSELLNDNAIADDREPKEVIDHIKEKLRNMSDGD